MKKLLYGLVFVFLILNSVSASCAEKWDPNKIYAAPGSIVEFEGKFWKNLWWTHGDSPAEYQNNSYHVWRPVTNYVNKPAIDPVTNSLRKFPGWDPNKVYAAPGSIVEFEGKFWKNLWWTQGNSPAGYHNNPYHVWRPVELP